MENLKKNSISSNLQLAHNLYGETYGDQIALLKMISEGKLDSQNRVIPLKQKEDPYNIHYMNPFAQKQQLRNIVSLGAIETERVS